MFFFLRGDGRVDRVWCDAIWTQSTRSREIIRSSPHCYSVGCSTPGGSDVAVAVSPALFFAGPVKHTHTHTHPCVSTFSTSEEWSGGILSGSLPLPLTRVATDTAWLQEAALSYSPQKSLAAIPKSSVRPSAPAWEKEKGAGGRWGRRPTAWRLLVRRVFSGMSGKEPWVVQCKARHASSSNSNTRKKTTTKKQSRHIYEILSELLFLHQDSFLEHSW